MGVVGEVDANVFVSPPVEVASKLMTLPPPSVRVRTRLPVAIMGTDRSEMVARIRIVPAFDWWVLICVIDV